MIYQCPVTQRFYDPLAVKRALTLASRGQFNQLVRDTKSEDAVTAARAQEQLLAAARSALGLNPIDSETGEGVTEDQVLLAITAFTRWLRGKGATVPASRSGAPCTDCPPGR